MKKLIVIALCCLSSACATVEPWERGRFTKKEMQFEPDSMHAAFRRHVYFAKEASSGGTSTSGGGCGCN
jgi:hypothetical protein